MLDGQSNPFDPTQVVNAETQPTVASFEGYRLVDVEVKREGNGWRVRYFFPIVGVNDDLTPIRVQGFDRERWKPHLGWSGIQNIGLDRSAIDALTLAGFTSECSGGAYGCTDAPGQQIVIWYEIGDGDAQPDVQTIYYHVNILNFNEFQPSPDFALLAPNSDFEQWESQCSGNLGELRPAIWDRVTVQNDPALQVCRVAKGEYLGQVLQIGYSSGIHLHYELWIDWNNDGAIPTTGYKERFDPLIAPAMLR